MKNHWIARWRQRLLKEIKDYITSIHVSYLAGVTKREVAVAQLQSLVAKIDQPNDTLEDEPPLEADLQQLLYEIHKLIARLSA